MVSLRVATERAELAKVERQIYAARSDIRSLQTELGTRGRMTQLEAWNSDVLALSAPTSAQFVKDRVTLARFEQRTPTIDEQAAQVRMAAAETGAAAQPPAREAAPKPAPHIVAAVASAPPRPAAPMVRQASYDPEADDAGSPPAAQPSKKPKPAPVPAKPLVAAAAPAKPTAKPVIAAVTPTKPAARTGTDKPAAEKPRAVKVAAQPAAKPAKPAAAPARVAAASTGPAASAAKGSGRSGR
jgi:hypothetical protein